VAAAFSPPIAASRVKVVSITAGSVIVRFLIMPHPTTSVAMDTAALATALGDDSSGLTLGGYPASGLTYEGWQPKVQTQEPSAHTNSEDTVVALVLALIVCVTLLAAGAIYLYSANQKKRVKELRYQAKIDNLDTADEDDKNREISSLGHDLEYASHHTPSADAFQVDEEEDLDGIIASAPEPITHTGNVQEKQDDPPPLPPRKSKAQPETDQVVESHWFGDETTPEEPKLLPYEDAP